MSVRSRLENGNESTNGLVGSHQGDKQNNNERDGKVNLKRQVGLLSGIALIVGTMIGSGIFVSPVGVLRQTESVGMSLVIWLACGILSTFGALCYAELGTIILKSGAEYVYLYEAFGGIPAYIFAWSSTLVFKPPQISIIAITFGAYMAESLIPAGCGTTVVVAKLFAVLAILLITYINCKSVKWATSVQNIFTVAKLLALAIIFVVGVIRIFNGYTEYISPSTIFQGSSTKVFSYGIAFYQGLWAYDGWNQLNYITEELVNPYRNLPLAILIGIPMVTLIYILVNIAYFTVLTPTEMLSASAVAVTFANRTLGPMAWIIPFFVCCSTFGAANGTLFTASRLCYVAGREGQLVEVMSMVHVKRFTPTPALLFTSIVSILMLIPNDFDTLVNYFSFAAWLFYGLTTAAVLVLRYQHPEWTRPIKVPLVIPIIVVIASVYLVIAPIIDDPQVEFLYAAMFILAGLIFYFPFIHYGYRPRIMKHFTTLIQVLLEVAPSFYLSPEEEQELQGKP
ncbi:b(0,+)-type amino acid transporter 1-like isoform X2 [Apostichopus japonicus]|uniref:b(0,+)-type amino acid transporter 1-like isoform X2 n=1 Tax=Stichopus japonicus TaxID=307972 RepID=UPI003AB3BD36